MHSKVTSTTSADRFASREFVADMMNPPRGMPVYIRRLAAIASLAPMLAFSQVGATSDPQSACIGEQGYLNRTSRAVEKSLRLARERTSDAIHPREVVVSDGTHLRGYLVKGRAADGFVLAIQGNGISAREIALRIADGLSLQENMYAFDYRGHGESGGTPKLSHFADDFRQIFNALVASSRPESIMAVYGFSQGGIVAAAMMDDLARYQGVLILDGTPSRVPSVSFWRWTLFRCPPEYDAVARVAAAASLSRAGVIRGSEDLVVTKRDGIELYEAVRERGGIAREFTGSYHPFSPKDNIEFRLQRLQELIHELRQRPAG